MIDTSSTEVLEEELAHPGLGVVSGSETERSGMSTPRTTASTGVKEMELWTCERHLPSGGELRPAFENEVYQINLVVQDCSTYK